MPNGCDRRRRQLMTAGLCILKKRPILFFNVEPLNEVYNIILGCFAQTFILMLGSIEIIVNLNWFTMLEYVEYKSKICRELKSKKN